MNIFLQYHDYRGLNLKLLVRGLKIKYVIQVNILSQQIKTPFKAELKQIKAITIFLKEFYF